MAPMAKFERRGPLVKLGQQRGLNLLKLLSDPLLVFIRQHVAIIGHRSDARRSGLSFFASVDRAFDFHANRV